MKIFLSCFRRVIFSARRLGFAAALWGVSAAVGGVTASDGAAGDAKFMTVGAASEEITPETPVRLGGYASRTKPHEGVRTPISTRVLYLSNGEDRLIWTVSDLIGFELADVRRIQRAVSERTGVPPDRVIVSATHTHSAPATAAICSPKETAYLDDILIPRLVRASERAVAESEECSMTVAQGMSDLAHDRRNDPRPGDGAAPNPDRARAVVDFRVPAVAFRRADGTIKAVLMEYAMHPTSWNDQLIGAEWPGAAARAIQKTFGADTQPIILQGAAGNLGSPSRRAPPEEIDRWGEILVASAADALRQSPPLDRAEFAVDSEILSVDYDRFSADEITRQAGQLREQFKARPDLIAFTIDPWEKTLLDHLQNGTEKSEEIPFVTVALGNHVFVTTPFETFSHLNQFWAGKTPFEVHAVGYSNGVLNYFPSADACSQGGYEPNAYVWYGRFPMKPGALERLADDLIPLIERVGNRAIASP